MPIGVTLFKNSKILDEAYKQVKPMTAVLVHLKAKAVSLHAMKALEVEEV
jgi:hypothetical protein